jgi:hypothetical protein
MANLPRRRTMEDICTIAGTKVPAIPAIPPDSVPNLESIRMVYDIAFAPSLDKFLESSNQWFTLHGFDLLASNRTLLGLMLAYLTLVSTNHDKPINANPTLVSQEARVTWAMLGLCTTPTPSNQPDDEADILARRYRTVESILTGEPLEPSTLPGAATMSLSEFVHQESDDNDSSVNMDITTGMNSLSPVNTFSTTSASFPQSSNLLDPLQQLHHQQLSQMHADMLLAAPTVSPSPFNAQVARRTHDFWSTLESIATSQTEDGTDPITGRRPPLNTATPLIPQLRSLLDGKEQRDILYATCLLGWGPSDGESPTSERELGKRLLQNEFLGGRARSLVLGSVAGMCLRGMGVSDGAGSV